MSREPVRIALVMDHPAQQFTRSIQLLADEPGARVPFYYWSAANVRGAGFDSSISWDIDLLQEYAWGVISWATLSTSTVIRRPAFACPARRAGLLRMGVDRPTTEPVCAPHGDSPRAGVAPAASVR